MNEWVMKIERLERKLKTQKVITEHKQALLDKAIGIAMDLVHDKHGKSCWSNIEEEHSVSEEFCNDHDCDDCWYFYLEWAVEKEIKEEQMSEDTMVEIDLNKIWTKYDVAAKLCLINDYIADALEQAREGNVAALTGAAPVWMYLKIAHSLHGKVTQLWYTSPATGLVLIFNHDPK